MTILRALLGKSSDAELLREMIGFTPSSWWSWRRGGDRSRLRREECGPGLAQRNGYRDRLWETEGRTSRGGLLSSFAIPLAALPGSRPAAAVLW